MSSSNYAPTEKEPSKTREPRIAGPAAGWASQKGGWGAVRLHQMWRNGVTAKLRRS